MERLPSLALDAMTDDQRRVYDDIVSGPRGHIGGPHWPWLRSPLFAETAQTFGRFCRFETSVSPFLIEVAILVTAVYWRARLEWDLHVPVARRLGMTDQAIEMLRRGEEPAFDDPGARSVHAFCRELWTDKCVAPETYQALVAEIGERACVELVGLLGYYALVSMTIVAFEVPTMEAAKDAPDPFAS